MTFTYGSVCSGIEAASLAWEPLGWRAAFFAEIEPFASAVLAHRWPNVPNLGDFTTIGADHAEIDLLVGGTPCQAFSLAGLRLGLDDDRGNLALEYCRLAERLRPRWLVWENVPGVLSSGEGHDFGSFLGALAELGYGWAYRVLDAQNFGVAQRRRRVFVVAHSGGQWQRAAAVLFERASLSGHPAPSREARTDFAGTLTASSGRRCGVPDGGDTPGHLVVGTLSPGAHPGGLNGQDAYVNHLVARCLTTKGQRNDSDSDNFIVADIAQVTSRTNRSNPQPGGPAGTLAKTSRPVAFNARQTPNSALYSPPLDTDGGTVGVAIGAAVRRLTPREWERLQGIPDGHTLVPYRGKPAKDSPRYRAIGNSMAVPVMSWIGKRIAMVDAI